MALFVFVLVPTYVVRLLSLPSTLLIKPSILSSSFHRGLDKNPFHPWEKKNKTTKKQKNLKENFDIFDSNSFTNSRTVRESSRVDLRKG